MLGIRTVESTRWMSQNRPCEILKMMPARITTMETVNKPSSVHSCGLCDEKVERRRMRESAEPGETEPLPPAHLKPF